MNRRFLFAVCFFLFAVFCPPFASVCRAAAFDPRGIGARALALGGAFVAGREDAAAIFWNPAALTTVETKEFQFSYEDLYSQGLVSFSNVAFAYPRIGPGAAGLSWTRLGVTDKAPFNYSENTYTFAYAMRPHGRLSLGAAINYYRLNSVVSGGGFGVNAGFLYTPLRGLFLGGHYQNIGRSKVSYNTGATDPLLDSLRLGGAYTYKIATLYADVEGADRVKPLAHFGSEFALFKGALSLRGGASRRVADGMSWLYAFGAGFAVRSLSLDYAFENHFDMGPSHIVSVRFKF